ncbi:sigma-54-dependent transcriptional regulator [Salipaludibacillus aurantiacus]|uniref:Two-component system, NtrC family, response regulator/two-component system, NtrC family, response regulator AtoC n=1 Tax=Salipaludibacillus aurantiacus TaxID=1601833 RepID=A0A1H9TZL2_9BACI|nr:sigma-54 dependent transcriptional regulator [Salipaludibacillus aurantiacus]SES02337.1 two-component system, NtrC family, response regulator/two-component system, NtrC family, response regulator AtoC [Salipaludibacillus aurantiacus]
MTRVIIVDDEEDLRGLLVKRLKRRGYEAAGFPSAETALDNLKKESYDLGIFDIRMDGMDGLTLLEKVKESESKAMEVIVLTGHGTIETAIEAMKKGAYDYLTKPYNLAELEVVLGKALEKKQLKEDHHSMKEWMHFRENTFDIIGDSEKIRQVKGLTAKVANADASILIEGESGTGKELFAKALHYWSERRDEPFITVNSGAIPEQLLESELFGHAKGAFTGAQKEKKGLVEVADKGTLFLDEIGEMPLDTQVKLLRFLETGEFRRVGEVRERRVNVRVVTATNRNMEEEVAKGNFREDLFYRLQVLKIVVPPLKERKDDIPELVQFYLGSKKEWKEKSLSDEALTSLMRYDYPGNVRELFHIIERGCLLCSGNTITSGDLLLPGGEDCASQTSAPSGQVERSLEEVEREHIAAVLDYTNWNKSDAAHILGISVRNIYRKIDQYELEKD